MPRDFEGESLEVPEDEERFIQARPGDHLLCSFQCENCHSQNIRGRSLRDSIQDEAFACQVRRANLDAFWSRAKGTVKNNMDEIKNQLRYAKALDFAPYPSLGPFRLGDDRGMMQAIGMEMRSMEAGTGPDGKVKHSTARKARSAYTNVWEASVANGGDISLASAKTTVHATRNPGRGILVRKIRAGVQNPPRTDNPTGQSTHLRGSPQTLRAYEEKWVCFRRTIGDTGVLRNNVRAPDLLRGDAGI